MLSGRYRAVIGALLGRFAADAEPWQRAGRACRPLGTLWGGVAAWRQVWYGPCGGAVAAGGVLACDSGMRFPPSDMPDRVVLPGKLCTWHCLRSCVAAT